MPNFTQSIAPLPPISPMCAQAMALAEGGTTTTLYQPCPELYAKPAEPTTPAERAEPAEPAGVDLTPLAPADVGVGFKESVADKAHRAL